jgi:opacity protein-like surface antigen
MRKLALVVVLVLLGVSAWAQENKYEFTVQGSGIFPKQTSKGALTSKPTSSGGVMAGFRVNLSNWVAVEGDYDYLRNSEKFFSSGSLTRIPMNLHAVTVTGIVRLPTFRNIRPFALAGGGLMVFDPRNAVGSSSQERGAFVYGGGFDVPVVRRVALRAQYRGFVYKTPDFDTSTLKIDKFTHAAVPSAGLVFTF